MAKKTCFFWEDVIYFSQNEREKILPALLVMI